MPNCFVIMPFRPELQYFYLAVKAHVEQNFPTVTVERGDDKVLTTSLLDKIVEYIDQADVVIADCTDRNPNVFYELGIAHAKKKPVVLITSDDIEESPTDIRAFEFISYAQLTVDAFFARLDNALQNTVGNPFAGLYPEALDLFRRFAAATHFQQEPSSEQDFEAVSRTMLGRGQPIPAEGRRRAELLVRRLLGAEPEIQVLTSLKEWVDANFP